MDPNAAKSSALFLVYDTDPPFNAASSAASLIYNAFAFTINTVCYFIGKVVSVISSVYDPMTGHSKVSGGQLPSTPINRRKVDITLTPPSVSPLDQGSLSIPDTDMIKIDQFAVMHEEAPNKENLPFSPIYDKLESPMVNKPIASVNAGDPGLYVGGAGINKAFCDVLGSKKKKPKEYNAFHKKLIIDLKQNEIKNKIRGSKPDIFPSQIQAVTVLYDYQLTNKDGTPKNKNCDGTVFIEEFNDDDCPLNNRNNRAMVYIVPPNRKNYLDDNAFLTAVEKTAKNIIRAQEAHNQWRISNNYPPIPVVRLCAFSSDSFAKRSNGTNIEKKKVLEATKNGIDSELPKTKTIKTIQYSNAFSIAMK